MKRCWFGLGLLLCLLVGGLLVTRIMTKSHGELSVLLDSASAAAAREDWAEAETQLHGARRKWEADWHFSAAFADHEPMEDMDGLFAQAEVYLRSRNPEALAATCAQLARSAEAIGEAHALNWSNLL